MNDAERPDHQTEDRDAAGTQASADFHARQTECQPAGRRAPAVPLSGDGDGRQDCCFTPQRDRQVIDRTPRAPTKALDPRAEVHRGRPRNKRD